MADHGQETNDMPPPLEDMSEMLKQVEKIKEVRNNKRGIEKQNSETKQTRKHASQDMTEVITLNTVDVKSASPHTKKQQIKKIQPTPASKTTSSDYDSFGGMKKGFLFGGGQQNKKHATVISKKEDDIPLIKPKPDQNQYQFSEVQDAMKAAEAFKENKDWITGDLLTKIMQNETLAKRLADPTFMSAVTEFQTNPTSAMAKYQDNPEMTKFLKDFCGLMGDHFNKLGDQQNYLNRAQQPTVRTSEGADLCVRSSTDPRQQTHAEDDEKMQRILNDPELRAILMTPEIQTLFEMLRTQPDKAQRILREASGSLQTSIRKLVKAGLLQFET